MIIKYYTELYLVKKIDSKKKGIVKTMEIKNISKENREVIISLSGDELIKICSVFKELKNEDKKDDLYYQLFCKMVIASDLCWYNHIGSYLLNIIEERYSNAVRTTKENKE